MKGVKVFLAAFAILAFASSLASASDPDPLQDFCVAINDTKDAGLLPYVLFLSTFMLINIFYVHDYIILLNGLLAQDKALFEMHYFLGMLV